MAGDWADTSLVLFEPIVCAPVPMLIIYMHREAVDCAHGYVPVIYRKYGFKLWQHYDPNNCDYVIVVGLQLTVSRTSSHKASLKSLQTGSGIGQYLSCTRSLKHLMMIV